MIILGFEITSKGNCCVRIANNLQTKSFTITTHKNLPYTHELKHLPLWYLNDADKRFIVTEIEQYILEFGNITQKNIVFS